MSHLPRPHVYLLTDFGLQDHYVAVMKAVILKRCPDAALVDVSHSVPPQNIEAGAYLLESMWPWLPDGSVVLAVVDPGVGTRREPAVFYEGGKTIVGPNNGLLSFLPASLDGRVLNKSDFWLNEVSATFHGRDVFAPCAAYLAAGGHWSQLGTVPTTPVACVGTEDRRGRVIYFDHFGNVITSIKAADALRFGSIEISGKVCCPMVRTYEDVDTGEPLGYIGSTGRVELAIRDGNARQRLNIAINDLVFIHPE